jgi:serine/threonine protein kinase
MSGCPSPEMLARLGTDAIGDPSFAAIESHVENCPECSKALEQLALDDPEPGRDRWPELPGFVIEEELGRGSMGVVYRARWTEIDRPVAIKVLPGGASGDPEHRRWLREARLLAKVPNHPHVVQLLAPGQHERCLYLVLDLVTGGSLKDRLAAAVPPRAAAEFLEATARGVHHINRSGVLHLDIKPSNILIDGPKDGPWEQAIPRVTDFGIARLGDDPGATQTVQAGPLGTPRYMAPEQISKDAGPLGSAADIHALGATFYHMLTGRPPFLSASIEETYRQVRDEDPIPPRRLISGIPRDLETICTNCLHKDPARRYGSALDLADDLRRWLDGYPILARPVSSLEHTWRWARRRPATAGLIAALGASLIAGSLGLLILWRGSEAARKTAQANYKATSESLDQILSVTIDAYNTSDPPGQFIGVLETARRQQIDQQGQNPGDVAGQQRLARIDRLLGNAYAFEGRLTEARSLLNESIDLWNSSLPPGPDAIEGRWEQMQAALRLGDLIGEVSELPENDGVITEWNKRSEAIARHLTTSRYRGLSLIYLSQRQRYIAHKLAWIGATDRSKRLLRANIRVLDSLPPSLASTPDIVLCRLPTRAALGEWDGDLEPLQTALVAAPGPPDLRSLQDLPGLMDICLAELTAWRFGWQGSPADSTVLTQDQVSPEIWAARVIEFLQSTYSAIGREPSSIVRVGWKMQVYASFVAAEQRRAGKLDDARRTAARLHAMAERLASLYPNEPAGQMLLSEAHVQEAKNAQRGNDNAIALRALNQAYYAARRASTLEPEYPDTRRVLVDRHRRLIKALKQ